MGATRGFSLRAGRACRGQHAAHRRSRWHAVRLVACTREDTFQSCHPTFGGKPHQQSRPSCTSAASSAEHVLEPFATITHIFEPFSALPMHPHAGVWLSACAVPTPGHLGTVVNWSSSNETVSSCFLYSHSCSRQWWEICVRDLQAKRIRNTSCGTSLQEPLSSLPAAVCWRTYNPASSTTGNDRVQLVASETVWHMFL